MKLKSPFEIVQDAELAKTQVKLHLKEYKENQSKKMLFLLSNWVDKYLVLSEDDKFIKKHCAFLVEEIGVKKQRKRAIAERTPVDKLEMRCIGSFKRMKID